jgi:hypothetical protein
MRCERCKIDPDSRAAQRRALNPQSFITWRSCLLHSDCRKRWRHMGRQANPRLHFQTKHLNAANSSASNLHPIFIRSAKAVGITAFLFCFLLCSAWAGVDYAGTPQGNAQDHETMFPAAGDEHWDDRFGPPGTNGPVHAIVFDSSGNLYAGGLFTQAGGIAANHIAKWDGTRWSPLGPGTNYWVQSGPLRLQTRPHVYPPSFRYGPTS